MISSSLNSNGFIGIDWGSENKSLVMLSQGSNKGTIPTFYFIQHVFIQLLTSENSITVLRSLKTVDKSSNLCVTLLLISTHYHLAEASSCPPTYPIFLWLSQPAV